MAAYSDITGQEPNASSGINTGTDLCPSSKPLIPTKSSSEKSSKFFYNNEKSSTNPISTSSTENPPHPSSSAVLSEEQLAQLPSIFRWKTHQQCLEMEGNIYPGHHHSSRGRMVMMGPQGGTDIGLLDSVKHSLLALFGFILSLAAAGAVLVLPFLVLGLVFYPVVCTLSTSIIPCLY